MESLAKTLIERETIDGNFVLKVMQKYEPKAKKSTVKTNKQKTK